MQQNSQSCRHTPHLRTTRRTAAKPRPAKKIKKKVLIFTLLPIMNDSDIAQHTKSTRQYVNYLRKKHRIPVPPHLKNRQCSTQINEEKLGQLIRALETDRPLAGIAQDIGTSPGAIRKILKKYDVPLKRRRLHYRKLPAEIAAASEEFKGHPWMDQMIAHKLGISTETVKKHTRHHKGCEQPLQHGGDVPWPQQPSETPANTPAEQQEEAATAEGGRQ